jgi:hypothetical protein
MMRQALIFLSTLLLTAPLLGQTVAPGSPQDYEAMTKAMEVAQSQASQPGDEKLDCDQLQEQIAAIANDPALQNQIKAAGDTAQQETAAMEAARSQMAARTIQTVIASMLPGGAMATMPSMAGQAQAQQAQAAQHVQSRMLQGQEMMTLMPKLMRGEHLIELGASKQCGWAKDVVPDAASKAPGG